MHDFQTMNQPRFRSPTIQRSAFPPARTIVLIRHGNTRGFTVERARERTPRERQLISSKLKTSTTKPVPSLLCLIIFPTGPFFKEFLTVLAWTTQAFCFVELVLLNDAPWDNAEVGTPTVREDENIIS